MAYFLRGNAYERQGQWDKALKEYLFLRDKYTDTVLGLQMPMYIAAYYIRKGQEGNADKAYREAAIFYEALGRDNQGKVLGYKASTLLRDAYLGAKEYERTETRNGLRNGHYERQLNTRVGTLILRVCRDRAGEFKTELLEIRQDKIKAIEHKV